MFYTEINDYMKKIEKKAEKDSMMLVSKAKNDSAKNILHKKALLKEEFYEHLIEGAVKC